MIIHICGSPGVIHRVKGWRLPSACVPYIGTPYEEVPTDVLEQYGSWFCGPERWLGHSFEIDDVHEELWRRTEG
jgi:hypothetical protein